MRLFRASACTALGGLALTGCAVFSSDDGNPAIEDHPQYESLQPEISRLVKEVRESKNNALLNALTELVAFDVFAIEQLSDLLDEPNPRLRSNALWVLGQITDDRYPKAQREIDEWLEEGLEDPDPLVRFEAATALVTRGHWQFIAELISGMRVAAPEIRFKCHETLLEVTSLDFGYRIDSPEEQREAALTRWQLWYDDWLERSGL